MGPPRWSLNGEHTRPGAEGFRQQTASVWRVSDQSMTPSQSICQAATWMAYAMQQSLTEQLSITIARIDEVGSGGCRGSPGASALWPVRRGWSNPARATRLMGFRGARECQREEGAGLVLLVKLQSKVRVAEVTQA